MLNRFKKYTATSIGKKFLAKLIMTLKEKGVENKKNQYLLNDTALQELSGFKEEEYNISLKDGINKLCLQKQIKKEKLESF